MILIIGSIANVKIGLNYELLVYYTGHITSRIYLYLTDFVFFYRSHIMKLFIVCLLGCIAAANAVSLLTLVQEEWKSFKV